MQQYSSLPEQNSLVDVMPNLTTVQQLRAELWLERSLNQLHICLQDYLVAIVTSQSSVAEAECDIFQTVAHQLRHTLDTSGLAIALIQASGICLVRYISSEDTTESAIPSIHIKCKKGKQQSISLHESLDIEDIEYLQKQVNPQAWQFIDETANIQGWIITAPSLSSGDTATEASPKLPTPFIQEFISRVSKVCGGSLRQLRQIFSLEENCQNLHNFNQQLERTNQLKNQFLANTSHEIRTPLSSIIGFTHLLLAQGYDPERERHREYLNIIQSSGNHLLALINDILDLSKIEANQLEVQWETVEVPLLCRNTLALVKEKAANKGLKISLDLEPQVTNFIADPLRLKQMLLNLLFNALKFTNQGRVGLEVKTHGSFIYFTVWDTGAGIPPEHQAELFQPYFQIVNSATSREEGTGLGLAVTRKLAELHGGWIKVESELNQGSRFTIGLPLNPVDEVGDTWEVSEIGETVNVNSPISIPQSLEILLVEDDEQNAQMMQTYLQRVGYPIKWVKNVEQMWQVLSEQTPNVILLDVRLPDADGLEIVKELRQNPRWQNVTIVAQTAMAMKGDREVCLAAGVDDYISKPINLPNLAALLGKYCQNR
ncbi:hybrid histidine kinase/response regulator HrmK [Calothrix sp. 336/3]|uniref:hybrid histidine kinase/response regulator HrmK n=1 Tax=Calothrix sp. 336/3 TaxID=1337936 RepID=UPI0004E4538C|nr:hybrid histidine kinase/response regulator HrmK [Calothrix sp. 336/3]AKG21693.1 chemotaxis protein CheY [Calothrix sp. 336/3]